MQGSKITIIGKYTEGIIENSVLSIKTSVSNKKFENSKVRAVGKYNTDIKILDVVHIKIIK